MRMFVPLHVFLDETRGAEPHQTIRWRNGDSGKWQPRGLSRSSFNCFFFYLFVSCLIKIFQVGQEGHWRMATQFFYALLWKRVLEFLYCKMKKSVRRSVLITCENVGNALEASWPVSIRLFLIDLSN